MFSNIQRKDIYITREEPRRDKIDVNLNQCLQLQFFLANLSWLFLKAPAISFTNYCQVLVYLLQPWTNCAPDADRASSAEQNFELHPTLLWLTLIWLTSDVFLFLNIINQIWIMALIKLFLRLIFTQLKSTQVADYFDIYCCLLLYHSDVGALFPFNNHANVQTRDSLVDI